MATHQTRDALGRRLCAARGEGRPVVAARALAFGTGVWVTSYAQLVPLGIYSPPWEYDAKTLATDLSYHLVYGLAVSYAYEPLRDLRL